MSKFILQLSDTDATIENVGGKGNSLAKLTQAGLSVPRGFHVTTQAYRQFVAANGLQSHIMAAMDTTDIARPASLEAASQQIAGLFAAAEMPKEIAEAIRFAYADLKGVPVAVRSSATAEDLPETSFAGQQETYLNVCGEEAVLESVKLCWSSLWTGRAISYRLKNNVDQGRVTLAIVVQELVPAEASGVMFTANPSNGQRDEIVINAAWGLGEAVVSGTVTPDMITVSKLARHPIRRETATKEVMTVRAERGIIEQPVPEAKKYPCFER
jgi:phosphoenolpyruvate synthase/pyruvate phosphate dikinase